MRINGTLITTLFKGWVRMPEEGSDGKVFNMAAEPRAHFEKAQWESSKGKISLGDVYHTVDNLLSIEECLTCNKQWRAFPDELDQVVTPLPHSEFDADVGFHVR